LYENANVGQRFVVLALHEHGHEEMLETRTSHSKPVVFKSREKLLFSKNQNENLVRESIFRSQRHVRVQRVVVHVLE